MAERPEAGAPALALHPVQERGLGVTHGGGLLPADGGRLAQLLKLGVHVDHELRGLGFSDQLGQEVNGIDPT